MAVIIYILLSGLACIALLEHASHLQQDIHARAQSIAITCHVRPTVKEPWTGRRENKTVLDF